MTEEYIFEYTKKGEEYFKAKMGIYRKIIPEAVSEFERTIKETEQKVVNKIIDGENQVEHCKHCRQYSSDRLAEEIKKNEELEMQIKIYKEKETNVRIILDKLAHDHSYPENNELYPPIRRAIGDWKNDK